MSSSSSLANRHSSTTPILTFGRHTPSPAVENAAVVIYNLLSALIRRARVRNVVEGTVLLYSIEQTTEPDVPDNTQYQLLSNCKEEERS